MQRNIEKLLPQWNVTLFDIQNLLQCSERTVRNKLSGTTDFTYSEVKSIRDTLFPGMSIDYLFDSVPESNDKVN